MVWFCNGKKAHSIVCIFHWYGLNVLVTRACIPFDMNIESRWFCKEGLNA
jgi:hypothetical protein